MIQLYSVKVDIAQFEYNLPEQLIAKFPTKNRSESRLLVVDSGIGQFRHFSFNQLCELVRPGDLLVVNDTRVLPARLFGKKPTGGRVEVLLERILDAQQALVQLGSSKPIRVGQEILLEPGKLDVVDRDGAFFRVSFTGSVSVSEVFEKFGSMPLPPYINRDTDSNDVERYQTVYSSHPGAVAAPTAGLHFDLSLMDKLVQSGVLISRITLHVGAGTFQPVREDNVRLHKMHNERVIVDKNVCENVAQTKQNGGRVIAVGTTVVRALESAAKSGELVASELDTDLFILPGYKFNIVDALVTNFHLPKSTLIMMVCAFTGYSRTMAAYQNAIENNYRFYSYGDAMFVEKLK